MKNRLRQLGLPTSREDWTNSDYVRGVIFNTFKFLNYRHPESRHVDALDFLMSDDFDELCELGGLGDADFLRWDIARIAGIARETGLVQPDHLWKKPRRKKMMVDWSAAVQLGLFGGAAK